MHIFHKYELIEEDGKPKEVDVLSRNNPYAAMGQMQVCWIKKCTTCDSHIVSWLQNGKPHGGWHKVEKWLEKTPMGKWDENNDNEFRPVVPDGTPVVSSL